MKACKAVVHTLIDSVSLQGYRAVTLQNLLTESGFVVGDKVVVVLEEDLEAIQKDVSNLVDLIELSEHMDAFFYS